MNRRKSDLFHYNVNVLFSPSILCVSYLSFEFPGFCLIAWSTSFKDHLSVSACE